MPVEVVEAADLVRAVVGAVPRADAAVVGHLVQALGAVRGGVDRADVLAGRLFAVHAHERLADRRRGSSASAPSLASLDVVAVDAQPVHLAAAPHLALADHGDVVLRHASDDAGVAARARVEVDRHAPLVALAVVLLGPERQRARRRRVELGEVRPRCWYSASVASWRDGPALGRVVLLRLREEVRLAAGLATWAPDREAERVRRPQRVDVEAACRCRCARPSCDPSPA